MSESATPTTTTNTASVPDENGSDDDEQQVTNPLQKKEDAKVEKELDRVTDRVDEEEIGSEKIGNVSLSLSPLPSSLSFFQALTTINDKRHLDESKRQAQQAELANVRIRKEDVDLIVQELELSRSKAEKTLRQHHGDVLATLKALVNA